MAESTFRSNLLIKNRNFCEGLISSNLKKEDLVLIINDLLFASVSVIHNKEFIIHPVCLMNSIKNFIGDDKDNPSKPLLRFIIDYLFEFDFRKNDQAALDQIVKTNPPVTAFMGDLEAACQNADWEKAELTMAQIFIASDHSRATFDFLVELALQDLPQNGLFAYHILRAYQFQENKSDNWVFTKTIFDQISNQKLSDPHKATDATPEQVFQSVIESGEIILFSVIERIWNGDYVRLKGYKRELSYWLSDRFLNKSSNFDLIEYSKIENKKFICFIPIAEKIVKQNKSINKKAIEIIKLESIRGLSRLLNENQIEYFNKRFDNFSI